MSEKEKILDYLEKAYIGAKTADDTEMMCRISRAVIAFIMMICLMKSLIGIR